MMGVDVPLADLTGKARIRHAALHLFAARGYERTSLRQIAHRAHVSLALIAHHFGCKQALREAVDEHVLSCFTSAVAAEPPSRCDPAEATALRLRVVERVLDASLVIRSYVRRSAGEDVRAGGTFFPALMGVLRRVLLESQPGLGADETERLARQSFLLTFGPVILEPVMQAMAMNGMEPRAGEAVAAAAAPAPRPDFGRADALRRAHG